MNAIFKQGNVYIVVRGKYLRTDVDSNNIENLIWAENKSQNNAYLYGGRVTLKSYYEYGRKLDMCRIEIDGIELSLINDSLEIISKFSFEQVAAYLNQIENLGVDSFLENYKLQLQGLKSELEAQADGLQQELALNFNDDKAKVLDSIKKVILSLTCIIFSLLVNMNAGLENHHYTEAYDNIINLYF
jgi:hypothetical protein